MTPAPLSASRPASAPLHWLGWYHANRAAQIWTQSNGTVPMWYIPLGHVARRGVWLHAQWHAWPSPRHARLWRWCAAGRTDDQLDALSLSDQTLLLTSSDPSFQILNLFALFLLSHVETQGWTDFADPARSGLASLRWRPLWQRNTRNHQTGWQHPQHPWLFIPDWAPLAPLNRRMDWQASGSLGAQLATLIPACYADDPDWLMRISHTPDTLLGMQWAAWYALGIGYWDRAEEVASGPTR